MSRVLQDRGPDERLISFPTMLGLRFCQTSPNNMGHIGSLLEKISNSPLFPTRLQTVSRLISSPQFFSLQCSLCSLIVFTSCHCKFFDLWPSFWFAKFIWLICGWTFSVETCIVYFKRNAFVRMTIYSSLSFFLHNELLSNKFETPDVNFNTQDVRLDVQLPLLRYYISWGWGNVNANF